MSKDAPKEEFFTRMTDGGYVSIRMPKQSDWQCHLFGMEGYKLIPQEGDVPNRFWRWMQYLAFGNRWEKRK